MWLSFDAALGTSQVQIGMQCLADFHPLHRSSTRGRAGNVTIKLGFWHYIRCINIPGTQCNNINALLKSRCRLVFRFELSHLMTDMLEIG
jgi:hypothetical protein